jgi:DNA-binding response OmpR family regulator
MLKKTIWIVEDDGDTRFIYDESIGHRYQTRFFDSVQQLRDKLSLHPDDRPDLLIADLRLPNESFLTFLENREIRKMASTPLVVVSSLDDTDVLTTCFRFGAADYLTKPFNMRELMVKIDRLLSREQSELDELGFRLNKSNFTIEKGEYTPVHLTPKEYRLLLLFVEGRTLVLAKETIFREIWGETRVSEKTLDVHISNLRRKLNPIELDIQHAPPDSFRLCDRVERKVC